MAWLPRNRDEAKRLAESKFGANVFFSHNDSNRFHERCVESPNPPRGQSVILFAISKPLYAERLDLEPARRIIGYEPQDVWPQGRLYSVEGIA